jgi:hypothetical protein
MGPPSEGAQESTPAFQFVLGRDKGGATKSTIRSHAMSVVRHRQRRQREAWRSQGRGSAPSGMDGNQCGCPLLSGSLSQDNRVGGPHNIISRIHFGLCGVCGGANYAGAQSAPQSEGLEGQSLAITKGLEATFDPFDSMTELPQYLASKYFQEINAIKSHG